MRVLAWLSLVIVLAVPLLPAETLGHLLIEKQFPTDSFSAAELNQSVGGAILLAGPEVLELAYDVLGADSAFVSMHVVKYDKKNGLLQRSKLQIDNTDVCFGSPSDMMMADDFTLLFTHLSPSAECILVLDDRLTQRKVLYGFGPQLIAHNQIILTENMIHFSPVHPERIQLADLKLGTTTELYPPKGDALRAKLAGENAAHMPAQETCMKMNDPCEPRLFDEDVLGITIGPGGRFAMIVNQSANHVIAPNEPAKTFASQSVLYIYAPDDHGWKYCEVEISSQEAAMRTQASQTRSWSFIDTSERCTPALPVLPDMSTDAMNPSSKRAD